MECFCLAAVKDSAGLSLTSPQGFSCKALGSSSSAQFKHLWRAGRNALSQSKYFFCLTNKYAVQWLWKMSCFGQDSSGFDLSFQFHSIPWFSCWMSSFVLKCCPVNSSTNDQTAQTVVGNSAGFFTVLLWLFHLRHSHFTGNYFAAAILTLREQHT